MSVTSGFFNSKNGDRKYNAEHFGSIFAGIIRDGVFANYPNTGDELKVTAVSGAMKVQVGPGRCWFKNTWLNNDSVLQFNVPAADSSQARTDAVVVDVNLTTDVRKNDIKYITGQLGGGNPTLANGDGHYQYVLAYISVPAGATTPTVNGQVGVNKPTPYITGPLQTVSADNVLAEWRNAVNARIDAELYAKLAELANDIPVQFLYANDGDVLSCSKTFEELFDAYYDNRNGLIALYQPKPRTKPEKRLYTRTYTMEAGETGDTYPVKAFNFYFYDAESNATFAIRYTENSVEEVTALGAGLVVNFTYNASTGSASCNTSHSDILQAINNGLSVCGVYAVHPRYSLSTYDVQTDATAVIFRFESDTVVHQFTVNREYVSPSGIVDTVQYSEVVKPSAPLVVTFQSSPARCDVSYADLAAAIQAKRQIIAVLASTYSSTTNVMYTSDIRISSGIIIVKFRATNEDKYNFTYTSDNIVTMEYIRASESKPLLITFSGGEDDAPVCDTSYTDIETAYNAGREIIAQFQDGTMRYRSMNYEITTGPTTFTFHFVAITASSGTTPSSWSYRVKSYRVMPNNTVYYSGN